eukprot:CAMPEP_0169293378 /NCGR_PEP_ID=MMETSP1016-20121227/63261_1 /TAXON_ID=342587 /ORGANISM="Karlodinium micrum, Strain CCMP2283" /LENGTH=108 /DNA_ID=CAMNT_0009384071 /DNA_START=194 /DNA_END=517 /DNA_ORIENTATION=+
MPSGYAALWIFIGALFSGSFTVLLSLSTLYLSPVTARLAMTLAIPSSFVWDLFANDGSLPNTDMHGTFTSYRFIGVILILACSIGFGCYGNGTAPAKVNLAAERARGE